MYRDTLKKNYQTIVIKYRNLFPPLPTTSSVVEMISFTAVVAFAIIFLFLVLLTLPSSFFVHAVDMPPSPSPSSPPAIPPPPPPTVDTAIQKLLDILPKTLPNIEQKTDTKDGDIILSSRAAKKEITAATKVAKKSTMVTIDYNRGYVHGIIIILGEEVSNVPPEDLRYRLERLLLDDPTSEFLKPLKKRFSEEYIRGISQGLRDALKLGDLLGTITQKTPNKK
jgi:hypothetical protein